MHPTIDKTLQILDSKLDALMLALTVASLIGLIACSVHFFNKKNGAPSFKFQTIKVQQNLLTQRGDEGWPPVKEKSRMA
jgi:hypothetical protein